MRTRTLAAIGAGLAILVLGATLASAAGPATPYETLQIEAFDAQEDGRFADRMASAGDLDGDGVSDVWISAYSLSVGGASNVGRVYAMSGRTRQPIYRIDHPEPQPCMGFACGLGWSISNLDDIDGDGISDLVAAANRQNVDADGDSCTAGSPGCNFSQGKAYVFSGADGTPLFDLNNPVPQTNGYFGWASKAGDIALADGSPGQDGRSEILVGAFQNDFLVTDPSTGAGTGSNCGEQGTIPTGCRKDQGQSFIFNGADGEQLPGPRGTLNIPPEDRVLDETGRCVSEDNRVTQQNCGGAGIVNEGVGDVNADGFWDQSVTAWTTGVTQPGGEPCIKDEPNCNARQGRIHIYSGRDGSIIHTIDNPVPQEGSLFGLQIVQAGAPGDVDNDGFDDIYGNGFQQTGPPRENQPIPFDREGRSWVFSGRTGEVLLSLLDPTPEASGTFGYSLEKTDYNHDGIPDLYVGSFDGSYVFLSDGTLQKVFDQPEDEPEQPPGNTNLGRSVAAPGDLNGDCEPDFLSGSPGHDVRFVNDGRLYGYLSSGPSACPAAVPPPPPVPPAPPVVGPCGDPTAAGYLHPAKLRVSRARVLRSDRRLDVLAPITSLADGDVKVTFHADNRKDTFDADVSEANTALDVIRFLEPITRGQARLGTGIVNLTYLGDADTRPEFVRLRAASQRAELDVDEISLIADRLSATGSVTSRAEGVVRFRYSYVDPDGTPNVHEARAEIQDNGDWALEDDQVPAQLAQCGGYLSIQFTGYFPRRIRGEQLAYQLNAGQTRTP